MTFVYTGKKACKHILDFFIYLKLEVSQYQVYLKQITSTSVCADNKYCWVQILS